MGERRRGNAGKVRKPNLTSVSTVKGGQHAYRQPPQPHSSLTSPTAPLSSTPLKGPGRHCWQWEKPASSSSSSSPVDAPPPVEEEEEVAVAVEEAPEEAPIAPKEQVELTQPALGQCSSNWISESIKDQLPGEQGLASLSPEHLEVAKAAHHTAFTPMEIEEEEPEPMMLRVLFEAFSMAVTLVALVLTVGSLGRTHQRSGGVQSQPIRLRPVGQPLSPKMRTTSVQASKKPASSPATQPAEKSAGNGRKLRLSPLTVVLDMDETLLHAELNRKDKVKAVLYRPGARDLLHSLKKVDARVIVWTAGLKDYADPLLDKLDPTNSLIHHRLYRDSCALEHGWRTKDLSRLGLDLSRTIIVDNADHSFIHQPTNAVPIYSWYGEEGDRELFKTASLIDELHGQSDVRTLLAQRFSVQSSPHWLVRRFRKYHFLKLMVPVNPSAYDRESNIWSAFIGLMAYYLVRAKLWTKVACEMARHQA